ncbi:MAG TPA: YbjN domain-containing protein [Terracidiphilus sp.]
MPCPRCSAETLPNQEFCTKCGAALGAPENNQNVAAAAPATVQTVAERAPSIHPIPDGGLTMDEIVSWLQSGGYTAKVVAAENGKRHIVTNAHGTPFDIFTPGCESGRCASIEIVVSFSRKGKFNVSLLNEWNSDVPWCKAYYDTVNDPCLDMDIALSPGGTYESLNDQFATWTSVLGRFITKYDLR